MGWKDQGGPATEQRLFQTSFSPITSGQMFHVGFLCQVPKAWFSLVRKNWQWHFIWLKKKKVKKREGTISTLNKTQRKLGNHFESLFPVRSKAVMQVSSLLCAVEKGSWWLSENISGFIITKDSKDSFQPPLKQVTVQILKRKTKPDGHGILAPCQTSAFETPAPTSRRSRLL